MSDEVVGHMYEKVVIPPPEEIRVFPRRKPNIPPEEYLPSYLILTLYLLWQMLVKAIYSMLLALPMMSGDIL